MNTITIKELVKKELYTLEKYLSIEVVNGAIIVTFYNGAVVAKAKSSDKANYTIYNMSYNNEHDDEDYDVDYEIMCEEGTLPKYVRIEGIDIYFN